jgi:hypothetical protein
MNRGNLSTKPPNSLARCPRTQRPADRACHACLRREQGAWVWRCPFEGAEKSGGKKRAPHATGSVPKRGAP